MRASSLLLAVLFFELDCCAALPWSKDGIVHWLLQRQLSNVIAHTESSVGLLDFLTSTSASTSSTSSRGVDASSMMIGIAHTEIVETSTRGGPGFAPGVEHTEEPVTQGSSFTLPNLGGSNAETAHEEHPVPTTTPKTAQAPYIEATPTSTPHLETHIPPALTAHLESPPAPSPHTETPASPSPTSGQSTPEHGGSQGDAHSGSTGSPSYSGGSDSGAPPASHNDNGGSPGTGSPGAGASWSLTAPAPIAQISAYMGSQTPVAGQTLTINSQEVVVSASGSSLYVVPVATTAPQPASASVTKVWTEGGRTFTGVFAAPSATKGQASNAAQPSMTTKQAKATVASDNESSRATSSEAPSASNPTTTTASAPAASGNSPSSSEGSPTGNGSKSVSAISGGVAMTMVGLLFTILL